MNIDAYPTTLEAAYRLIQNHSSGKQQAVQPNTQQPRPNNSSVTGMQCVQRHNQVSDSDSDGPSNSRNNRSTVPGRDGRTLLDTQCYACGARGHYANNCPSLTVHEPPPHKDMVQQHAAIGAIMEETLCDASDDDGDESVGIGFQGLTHGVNLQDTESILIDTDSNWSVFDNAAYLQNVRRNSKSLRAYTNGGHQDSHADGDLPGLFTVWCNPASMLNILSFSEVSNHYRITVDTY